MSTAQWRLGWWEDLEQRMLTAGVVPLCSTSGCMQDAAVYDRETGQGFCFDCQELLLERVEALHIAPGLSDTLPVLHER